MKKNKINYEKYDLKWYVLNDCGNSRGGSEEQFKHYPYSNGDIKPFNVFCNWAFKEEAINLAIDYFDGKLTLNLVRVNRKESKFNTQTSSFETFDNPEVAQLKNDYEAFRYELMRALQWQEWSRCEYEILVCPLFVKADNYQEAFQKIDCYEQVLPNADIFAKYVLMTVNGTLDTNSQMNENITVDKDKVNELYCNITCALTHNIDACDNCRKCKGSDGAEIRMNLVRKFAKLFSLKLPWGK